MENLSTDFGLKKFTITDAAIEKMRTEFLPLTINGLEDKIGYQRVREARIFVKTKRVEVEKTRKELKEESLRYGRMVDGEAKRITSLLEPIELHLEGQEKQVDEEKERIRLAKEEEKRSRFNARVQKLSAYSDVFDALKLMEISDDEFEIELKNARDSYMAAQAQAEEEARLLKEVERQKSEEAARLQKEADEKRAAEDARLRKIAQEQEAERARLAEIERAQREKERVIREEQERKEAALKAEREAIEAEKRAIEETKRKEESEKKRQVELEAARKEAEEKARFELERKMKLEAEAKAERERLDALEEERKESLRPDREKLIEYAFNIAKIPPPQLSNPVAINFLNEVVEKLRPIISSIKKRANSLHVVDVKF